MYNALYLKTHIFVFFNLSPKTHNLLKYIYKMWLKFFCHYNKKIKFLLKMFWSEIDGNIYRIEAEEQ